MNTVSNLDFARVAMTARLREQSDANVRDDVADRARLQAAADQHLRDNLPRPESRCARDARINEGFDETPTDGEILDVYVENFGGSREQAIERLAKFDVLAALGDLMVAV